MNEFLHRLYWGNEVKDYLTILLTMLVIWVLYWLIKKKLIIALTKLANKTATQFDNVLIGAVDKYAAPFVYLLIQISVLQHLEWGKRGIAILSVAMALVSTYYLVRIVNYSLQLSLKTYMELKGEPAERLRQLNGIMLVVKSIVWCIGILMLVDNLGYDITAVVAGLGVGGIAIALAAQNILSDLFSYFVIFFDKPFEIGDAILVDGQIGAVERIGIKTTHLRSFAGEQLVMPNAELVKSTIQNFKRLNHRRVLFSIGVTYDTSPQMLEEIPGMLRDIITNVPETDFQRAHLASFGDFSLNFEIVFNVPGADYNLYMNTKQAVFLQIISAFNSRKIDFAFPSQTLYLQKA